ncbi:hypothetical protein Tco_0744279 [Tanacetum coccineum]
MANSWRESHAKEVEEWEKWRDLNELRELEENLVVASSDEEIVKFLTQHATTEISGEDGSNLKDFIDVLTGDEFDITRRKRNAEELKLRPQKYTGQRGRSRKGTLEIQDLISYRGQWARAEGTSSSPNDIDPKGDTRNRRCKLPKTTTNAHSRRATRGERILLDHLVKNITEGKDKQRSGGKKDAP